MIQGHLQGKMSRSRSSEGAGCLSKKQLLDLLRPGVDYLVLFQMILCESISEIRYMI